MILLVFRLFTQTPQLLFLFPSLLNQFPTGKVEDRDAFRRNELIRRHGAAVVFMLDQMISEIDNFDYLKIFFQKAVEKHLHLKKRNMKGEYFKVRNLHVIASC